LGKVADRIPGEQATFAAWQQSMGKGGAHTAAVEVDDAMVLAARKDHPAAEGILTLLADQAGL